VINNKAQPIQFYPDELIKEMWREWSEDVLFEIPKKDFHSSTGFQKAIGSTSANERSRATEAYRLGLLKGRLVQGKEAIARGLPPGWGAVCAGEPVHTHLGYIAYAIGNALSKGCIEPALAVDGLNILHLVFALSLGIEDEGQNLSVLLMYAYALSSYRQAIDPKVYEAHEGNIKRWVAAAVFDTIDSAHDRELVTQKYINSTPIDELLVMYKLDDKPPALELRITPKKLVQLLSDKSTARMTISKESLYWANSARGIYSRGSLAAGAFLNELLLADREIFKRKKISILSAVLEADPSEDSVLESMGRAFEINAGLASAWKKMMKKLTKGVYEALRYLEDGIPETIPKVFYVHGVDSAFDHSTTNTIRVPKEQTPIKPEEGSMIKVGNASFTLKAIKESGAYYEFTLGPAVEGQPA